eukprot:132334-Pyramimonas_sp.AAC.1
MREASRRPIPRRPSIERAPHRDRPQTEPGQAGCDCLLPGLGCQPGTSTTQAGPAVQTSWQGGGGGEAPGPTGHSDTTILPRTAETHPGHEEELLRVWQVLDQARDP